MHVFKNAFSLSIIDLLFFRVIIFFSMNFANYLNMPLFFTLICELFSYCQLDTNHIWERRIYTKELPLSDWLVGQHID